MAKQPKDTGDTAGGAIKGGLALAATVGTIGVAAVVEGVQRALGHDPYAQQQPTSPEQTPPPAA